MKKKKILTILIFMICCSLNAQQEKQDSIKTSNPILYLDLTLGKAFGPSEGLSTALTLNYQVKKNLFSLRYLNNTKLEGGFLFLLPVFESTQNLEEVGFLYGRRFNENKGFSQSFSLGVSYNTFAEYTYEDKERINVSKKHYFGIPFEFNIHLFKREKSRFRLFQVFPVGEPTGLKKSFGFKIYGNISKESYIGIGLNFGFGYHKKYESQ